MANSNSMSGDQSSSQGEVFVKQPGHDSIYYVFRTIGGGMLYYNIINMSLAAGLGSVTVKNATLYTPTCERQVAVRHCNGVDIWILSKKYNSSDYYAFLLTANGLNTTPVITSIGDPLTNGNSYGQMKVSPDGKKIAVASNTGGTVTPTRENSFELYDFDAATGILSNSLALITTSNYINNCWPYGVEFSADGSKVYMSTIGGPNPFTSSLWQWDLCVPQNSIASTVYSLALNSPTPGFSYQVGSLQRAIDGKIYMNSFSQSISVINNPNGAGAAMNFSFNTLNLAPKSGLLGLPNYINPYQPTKPTVFSQTVACQDMQFNAPSGMTYTSGCSAIPYPYSGYVWDFGDPASGTANTSTTQAGTHRFSTTGTYTVSVILQSPCRNDTVKQQVVVTSLSPSIALTGTTSICKGDKRTYTVSGGTTYKWSNNITTPTITLNPTTTTVYTVTGTTGSCSTSKQMTITVNPCTDITSYGNAAEISIFPSPFTNELHLHTATTGELIITDYSGKVVYTKTLAPGDTTLSTMELPAGIYFTTFTTLNGVNRSKLMKQ